MVVSILDGVNEYLCGNLHLQCLSDGTTDIEERERKNDGKQIGRYGRQRNARQRIRTILQKRRTSFLLQRYVR
jgi:hypothetical protein